MVNESRRQKVLIALLCFSMLASSTVFAVPFRSVRAVGLLTSMESLPDLEEPRTSDNFFGSLDPDISEKGAVKTYSIKVVRKEDGVYSPARSKSVSGSNKDTVAPHDMLMPVMGRVSSLFGNRRHPKTKKFHFHSGIDIVARKGTPIVCSSSGRVSYTGWRRGYGLMVIVDHGNDLQTVYAHCSKVAVKSGQTVNAGQRVAYVGSTGVATGSHLHFEVRRSGNVRNPFRYLNN